MGRKFESKFKMICLIVSSNSISLFNSNCLIADYTVDVSLISESKSVGNSEISQAGKLSNAIGKKKKKLDEIFIYLISLNSLNAPNSLKFFWNFFEFPGKTFGKLFFECIAGLQGIIRGIRV